MQTKKIAKTVKDKITISQTTVSERLDSTHTVSPLIEMAPWQQITFLFDKEYECEYYLDFTNFVQPLENIEQADLMLKQPKRSKKKKSKEQPPQGEAPRETVDILT